MRHLAVVCSSLAVTACLPVVPLPTPKGPAEHASEVTNEAAVTPRDGAGAIWVAREKILHDFSCVYDILLDGQYVAALRRGEQVTLYADPGHRVVGVSIRGKKGCEPALANVPVEVVAHATTQIRVSGDLSYDLKVEATTR